MPIFLSSQTSFYAANPDARRQDASQPPVDRRSGVCRVVPRESPMEGRHVDDHVQSASLALPGWLWLRSGWYAAALRTTAAFHDPFASLAKLQARAVAAWAAPPALIPPELYAHALALSHHARSDVHNAQRPRHPRPLQAGSAEIAGSSCSSRFGQQRPAPPPLCPVALSRALWSAR